VTPHVVKREKRACDVTDRQNGCYRYGQAVTERDEFLPPEANAFRHSRVCSDPVSLHFSSFFPSALSTCPTNSHFFGFYLFGPPFFPSNQHRTVCRLSGTFLGLSSDLILHKSSFIVRSFPEDVPSSTLSLTSTNPCSPPSFQIIPIERFPVLTCCLIDICVYVQLSQRLISSSLDPQAVLGLFT
jgi:hypothetical protein